jgi:uncharacterized protein (TIGR02145 family)
MKTKNRFLFYTLIATGLILIMTNSCKKDVYNPPYMTDQDGNVYTSVTIGTQEWMVENLKTTKYNDGTPILLVTGRAAWKRFTPGYSWYDNDKTTYKATYGALYNWYAVDSASNGGKNVCPVGWHVPSYVEWSTLTTYMGGDSVAGGKLKETGTAHWLYPNTGATNETGFTAFPGGLRSDDGSFNLIGSEGYWWCETDYSPVYAYFRDLLYFSGYAPDFGDLNKFHGLSVRCLRD